MAAGWLIKMRITEMQSRTGSIKKCGKDAAVIRIARYSEKDKQGRPSELF